MKQTYSFVVADCMQYFMIFLLLFVVCITQFSLNTHFNQTRTMQYLVTSKQSFSHEQKEIIDDAILQFNRKHPEARLVRSESVVSHSAYHLRSRDTFQLAPSYEGNSPYITMSKRIALKYDIRLGDALLISNRVLTVGAFEDIVDDLILPLGLQDQREPIASLSLSGDRDYADMYRQTLSTLFLSQAGSIVLEPIPLNEAYQMLLSFISAILIGLVLFIAMFSVINIQNCVTLAVYQCKRRYTLYYAFGVSHYQLSVFVLFKQLVSVLLSLFVAFIVASSACWILLSSFDINLFIPLFQLSALIIVYIIACVLASIRSLSRIVNTLIVNA